MSELEIRPLRPDEFHRFAEISTYAFSGKVPDERADALKRRIVPERDVLVAVEADEIVSQVLMYEFGVWIDGARFPTAGLADVATVPERARHGYARHLLRAALPWMRDTLGVALATLYPTVYPLYSGLGWTLAEDGLRYRGPAEAFRPSPRLPVEPGGRVLRRPATRDDVDLLEPIYRAFAAPRSGYLDRPRWYWEDSVLRAQGTTPRWLGLWYGADGELSGYVLYDPSTTPGSSSDPHLYELIASRAAGYRDLLTFVSAHNLWNGVTFDAGRDVPWTTLVANPHLLEAQVPLRGHFMLRLIDVQRAICLKRPTAVDRRDDLTLNVRDDDALWNDGTWLIGQRGDRWTCEAAPDREPAATVDIRTLAALFTGFLPVRQALEAGLLWARDDARSTLESLFATQYPPRCADHF
ncbi:MAG: GNAT family N-acetyltransferase [Chloroflexota bacterium]